eukprot:scaffold194947_cov47-Prasinocladus_malaysianus.AAC.1
MFTDTMSFNSHESGGSQPQRNTTYRQHFSLDSLGGIKCTINRDGTCNSNQPANFHSKRRARDIQFPCYYSGVKYAQGRCNLQI